MKPEFYIRIVVLITFLLSSALLISMLKLDMNSMRKSFIRTIILKINKYIRKHDALIEESLFKNRNTFKNKYNQFLNELRIDIELFNGISLTFFKILLYFISGFITFLLISITGNWLLLVTYPLIVICIVCILFSTSLHHKQRRIIDVIDTENLLSIEMRRGFNTVVKDNLTRIPISIREYYADYLNNVENLNYPSEDALRILKMSLGNISYDFLSKVNIEMNYREEGTIETFKDIVELNNIRKLARSELNKTMRRIFNQFIVALIMALVLLLLEILMIKAVRWFYLKFFIGQILTIVNIMVVLAVYLRINIMKAEEL